MTKVFDALLNVALTIIAISFAAFVWKLDTISTSSWKERCRAAEAVIDQVEEDEPDYVMDVLCEGDAYQNWLELAE